MVHVTQKESKTWDNAKSLSINAKNIAAHQYFQKDGTHADENTAGGIHAADGNG